ncbi:MULTISPECIES: ABC-F family ATP-binding cassette domain-containing protein [unclassified Luteococcus]|uniref:ABC-F family ATP-binding cassette domain-containing protein n=1 Tax=unclassified Luteococcus TaxID=2639923 RepID=UPI00313BBA76
MFDAPQSTSGAHLRVDGVSKSYPARRVLTNVGFSVAAGDRAALIGENGTGKSTILRLVAGLETPDAGEISTPITLALYHQQAPFAPDATLAEVSDDALAPVRHHAHQVARLGEAMAAAPEDATLADSFAHAVAEAERTDAWGAERRWEMLLDGLGLAGLDPARRADELSGGQVARLCLAWVLVQRAELLLLDEPTNHLDDTAAALVSQMVAEWPGPVLLASHDRAFLDETITSLVDLDPAPRQHRTVGESGVTRFTGSYTDYLASRGSQRERWQRQYEDEQAELNRLRERVRKDQQVGHANWQPRSETRMAQKFYADRNATVVSRRVNDARQDLERLEAEQVRKPPRPLTFRGLAAVQNGAGTAVPPGSVPSGPVLVASELAVNGRLPATDLAIGARDRWLVEGPNGCGKSTLLAVLDGLLEPTAGEVHRPERLRVALLGQEPAPVAAGLTANAAYRAAVGEKLAEQVPLGAFGLIAGRDLNRPVAELSVGQRRRLDLACVLASPPDVLLLDEPTNHLSLQLATELEASIGDYPGAVVVASHDRWLRRRWTGLRLTL